MRIIFQLNFLGSVFPAAQIADAQHDEPDGQDVQRHLGVGDLVHHEGDEQEKGDAEVVYDRVAYGFEVQAAGFAFAHFSAAEADVGDDDDEPADEHGGYGDGEKVHEYLAGEQVVEHDGDQGDAG